MHFERLECLSLVMNCWEEEELPLENKIAFNGKVSELFLHRHACKLIARFERLVCTRVWINCWEEEHLPHEAKITIDGKISELHLHWHACKLITRFESLDGMKVWMNSLKEEHLPCGDKVALKGKVSGLCLQNYACRMILHFKHLDDVKVRMECSKEKEFPELELDGSSIRLDELILNGNAWKVLARKKKQRILEETKLVLSCHWKTDLHGHDGLRLHQRGASDLVLVDYACMLIPRIIHMSFVVKLTVKLIDECVVQEAEALTWHLQGIRVLRLIGFACLLLREIATAEVPRLEAIVLIWEGREAVDEIKKIGADGQIRLGNNVASMALCGNACHLMFEDAMDVSTITKELIIDMAGDLDGMRSLLDRISKCKPTKRNETKLIFRRGLLDGAEYERAVDGIRAGLSNHSGSVSLAYELADCKNMIPCAYEEHLL
eukprot:GHVN01071587.1.p1 GENE.GHVN01071587.1~~GHVN01071587.1.p1  ORF type:complete len:435 (-),score=40.18 GHVN01071587.1:844-2148(-)